MRRARVEDQPTRGKTAPNRLRRLDVYLRHVHRGLITHRPGGLFVDLGFGRVPRTTLETAARLRTLDPSLRVLGVELDPERVAAAFAHADALTRFVQGGFDVDPGGPVRILRALNVLRQYPPEAVPAARVAMGRLLEEGGLLIEGTCDPFGRLMVVHLLQRQDLALHHRGVLLAARIDPDFHPTELQAVLPKDLMDKVVPGEPVHRFFGAWRRAWDEARPWQTFGPRAVYRQAARSLALNEALEADPWLPRHGYLCWRPVVAPLELPRFG